MTQRPGGSRHFGSRKTLALALGVIALVAGCGGGEGDGGPLRGLVVQEQTSSVTKAPGGYMISWAARLANPNPWHFGENVVATVTASDAAGKEVAHADQPLDAVPPGGSVPVAGQVTTVQRPVKVRVTYRTAEWREAARIPSAFKPFPITGVTTTRLDDGSYLITGTVENPFQRPAGSLVVTALLRDGSGRLIGGGTSYVDDVRATAPRRFIITSQGVAGRVPAVHTEVAARTWGSSGRPYELLALSGAVPRAAVAPTTPPFAEDRGPHRAPEGPRS